MTADPASVIAGQPSKPSLGGAGNYGPIAVTRHAFSVSWLSHKPRQPAATEEGCLNNRIDIITDAAVTHVISPWCRGRGGPQKKRSNSDGWLGVRPVAPLVLSWFSVIWKMALFELAGQG